VARNFEGHDDLREEIQKRIPKFGNDQETVDALARRVGEIILDALDAAPLPPDHLVIPGFYSLLHHHTFADHLPATPDGRRRGEPFSENQSPSYGTDTRGLTALLQSVARLPLDRTALGGLNVKFGGVIPAAKVRNILDTFFALGGLHIGFSFVDRQTLTEAREHPEQYRTLTVRMYGFSEYFVSLSPMEQQELIERTEHGGG
jgi:formate C-acetyltransferase